MTELETSTDESGASAATKSGGFYRLIALGASTIFAIAVAVAAWVYYSEAPGVDFASFWAAGRLALEGQAPLAYDAAAHRAVELTVANIGGPLPFPYPPPFLFLVVAIAFHPFWLAYLLWMGVTAGLYWVATIRFTAPRFAFAHPATLVNAIIGQNGFLTSGIFLLGISALAKRPFAAGALFGLLVIKPQLGVLIPLALLAAREWRAIGGAALSSIALLLAAAAIFGLESYAGFAAITNDYAGHLSAARWKWVELASVFGFFRFFGVSQTAALASQAIAAIAAAILVWRAWALGLENRGPVLAAATMLVPPYLFTYDSLLLILPLAWLLRDRAHPWRPAIVWLLLLIPLFGYFDIYRGPSTIPVAAALCLWWLTGDSRKGEEPATP